MKLQEFIVKFAASSDERVYALDRRSAAIQAAAIKIHRGHNSEIISITDEDGTVVKGDILFCRKASTI